MAKPATKLSRPDQALALIAKVSTGEDARAAVLATLALRPGELEDTHRAFVRDNIHLVHSLSQQAETTLGQRDEALTIAQQAVKQAQVHARDARQATDQARKLVSERKAGEVKAAHGIVTVHKIMTSGELAAAWGVNKNYVSWLTKAGRTADTLGVSGIRDLVELREASKRQSSKLNEALAAPGATMATVRQALAEEREDKAEAKRAQVEASKGDAETPEVEARTIGLRFAALMVQLNTIGATIAPDGDIDAEYVLRRVETAIAAYRKRNAKVNA